MAYRRRQGITKSATFKEDHRHDDDLQKDDVGHENGSLAARAMKASAAHRDSAAYGYAYASSPSASTSASASTSSSHSGSLSHRDAKPAFPSLSPSKGSFLSGSSLGNDTKYGFWGILAHKAKSILEDDNMLESPNKIRPQVNDTTTQSQLNQQSCQSSEGDSKIDNAKLRKRLDAITSSLNNLGDTLGNAFEEGRTIVETKTADIIQETRSKTSDIIHETRKFQIRRRGGSSDAQDQVAVVQNSSWQRPVVTPVVSSQNQGTQLKASRDVAIATAAKAKVLLRELKTVKSELAFAKQRCSQLEEENKRLRESREKGDNQDDDDLIRLQLESLLAEKARLAHENALHARENRFLREIVEYHRLTMKDTLYLGEGAEEVPEDYPFYMDDAKSTPTSPLSPMFFQDFSHYFPTQITKEQKRESLEDELNNMPSSSSSSPPKPSLLSLPPETFEPLKGHTVMQKGADEKIETATSARQADSRTEYTNGPEIS